MEILLFNFSLFFPVSFCLLTSSPASSHISALYSLLPFLFICSQSHWKKYLKKYTYRQQKLNQREILLPMNTSHIFSLSMMWKPAALQHLSPAPTKRLSWNWKQNVEGGHKLHEAKQDRSACPNKGFSGNAEVSYSFSYGLMLYICYISLTAHFLSKPPIPILCPIVELWLSCHIFSIHGTNMARCWQSSCIQKHSYSRRKDNGSKYNGSKTQSKTTWSLPCCTVSRGCLAEEVIPKTCEADKYEAAGMLRTQRPLTSILRNVKAGWKWDLKVHTLGRTK